MIFSGVSSCSGEPQGFSRKRFRDYREGTSTVSSSPSQGAESTGFSVRKARQRHVAVRHQPSSILMSRNAPFAFLLGEP